ncbi:GNAT family N-acetyltransferase [Azospirillum sp. ST 5-10]|uniref:GNAT family N-acetyltransferase n=1 Tax=unclassified Azospirillum TaxID=2630922 RepID=UPI003F4A59AB
MPTFRKLHPAEWDRYERHLLRLDGASRFMRFAGTVSDEAIARRCRALDHGRTQLVGCFEQGHLRGAAEIATDRALWPHEAELAISLEGGFQDRGYGTALLGRALTIVRNRRIRRAHMLCLRENLRMRRLATRFGGRVSFDGGETTVLFELPPPTQMSLAVEAMEDGAGAVGTWLDPFLAPLPRAA